MWLLCAASILKFFSSAAQQNISAICREAHILMFVSTFKLHDVNLSFLMPQSYLHGAVKLC
jgi:hypothetical protein